MFCNALPAYTTPPPQRPAQPLSRDQADLAARYVPLARKLATKAMLANGNLADGIDSAALLALTLAASRYDIRMGVSFVSYAKERIRGAIKDELDAATRAERIGRNEQVRALLPSCLPLTSPVIERCSVGRDEPGVGAEVDSEDFCERLLHRLPPRLAKLCRLHYLEGWSQPEIARQLGVTRGRVSQLLTRARRRLRAAATSAVA